MKLMTNETCSNCSGRGHFDLAHGERDTCSVCLGEGTVAPKLHGLAAMLAAKRAAPAASPCVVYATSSCTCSLGTRGCGSYHGR
jgi:hypothetical protein